MTYTAIISVPVAVKFSALDDDDAATMIDDVMRKAVAKVPGAMKSAINLISLDDPNGVEVCRG